MSNHEIETRLPPPEGGRRAARPGHTAAQRLHASRERAAHRDSSNQDRGAPSARGQVLALLDRTAPWSSFRGADPASSLQVGRDACAHLIRRATDYAGGKAVPAERSIRPRGVHDQREHDVRRPRERPDVWPGSPIFNPCDWTTRGGPWGFGAWSFYWCDAAGDVCDGTSAHEINSDTPAAGPGGRGRIGEQELNASALRKAAASIEFRYKAVEPPSEANQLPAHGGSTQCGPLETIRPPRVNREDTVFGGLRLSRRAARSSPIPTCPASPTRLWMVARNLRRPRPRRRPRRRWRLLLRSAFALGAAEDLSFGALPPRRTHLRTRPRSGRRRRRVRVRVCGRRARADGRHARARVRLEYPRG